jgi:hypothetical protein
MNRTRLEDLAQQTTRSMAATAGVPAKSSVPESPTKQAVDQVLKPDPVEQVVAPAAIERALTIYQQLQPRDQSVVLQARKILTRHIYGMVDKGERDEQRLTVCGLIQLKAVERDHAIKSAHDVSKRMQKGV